MKSNLIRCNAELANIKDGLTAVFGDKIKVEIESSCKESESILIDGWIDLKPNEDDEKKWDLGYLTFTPQTRWEPEDCDLNDIGSFSLNDCMNQVIVLIATNIYNQFSQYQNEKSFDESAQENV